MHIGELPQSGACARCRQIAKRKMNHHGGRSGPKAGEPPGLWGGGGDQTSEQHARMQVGNHGARRLDPLTIREDHALGRAALDRDALHRRIEPHLAAGGFNRAHHRRTQSYPRRRGRAPCRRI